MSTDSVCKDFPRESSSVVCGCQPIRGADAGGPVVCSVMTVLRFLPPLFCDANQGIDCVFANGLVALYVGRATI